MNYSKYTNTNTNTENKHVLQNVIAEKEGTISLVFNAKTNNGIYGPTIYFDVYFNITNLGRKKVSVRLNPKTFKHIELFDFIFKSIYNNTFQHSIVGLKGVIIQKKTNEGNDGKTYENYYTTLRFKNQLILLAKNLDWKERDKEVGKLFRNIKTFAIEFKDENNEYVELDEQIQSNIYQPQIKKTLNKVEEENIKLRKQIEELKNKKEFPEEINDIKIIKEGEVK